MVGHLRRRGIEINFTQQLLKAQFTKLTSTLYQERWVQLTEGV